MEARVSHDRDLETPESKARWFRSLTLEERMEYLTAITDLVLENNPAAGSRKHAQSTSGRIRVLALPER